MGRHPTRPGQPFTPSEIHKRLRERRAAAGLCECGLRPPRPDRKMCQECSDDTVFRNRKWRHAE